MGEGLFEMLSTLKQREMENRPPTVEHPGIFFAAGNTNRRSVMSDGSRKRQFQIHFLKERDPESRRKNFVSKGSPIRKSTGERPA